MRSARTSVKAEPAGLPYSAVAHSRRRSASLLRRVAHQIGTAVSTLVPVRRGPQQASVDRSTSKEGSRTATTTHTNGAAPAALVASSSSATPLQPGDVLRDVPFILHGAEVAYVSSHPSLCADVFGVVPGEVWEMMLGSGGALLGYVAQVVGARAGKLYVLVCGDSSARALHIPHAGETGSAAAVSAAAPSSSPRDVRAALMAYHEACLLHHPQRALTADEAAEAHRLRGVHASGKEGESEENAQLRRDQQQELERRVRQVQTDCKSLRTRAAAEAHRVYTEEQRAFLQRAPDLYVAALPVGAEGGGVHSSEHVTSATAAAAAAASPSSSSSVYAAVARGESAARAVVLLPPRILVATGTVGWTGEGDVALLSAPAGLSGGEGSLSASVVL